MGNLALCLPVTLAYEGGWSNNPNDPGGATMKGVTQGTYNAFRRGKGQASKSVRDISEAELLEIYDKQYFRAIGGADLEPGVDLVSFDYAVNSGVSRAKKALANTEGYVGVERVKRICDIRLSFLHGLRTWAYFGKGWGRRVADVMVKGIRMASTSPGDAQLQMKIAAAEAKVRAKSASNAAASVTGASASGIVVSPLVHTQWWAIALGVLFLAILGGILFLKVRKHEDVADALEAAAEGGQ